MARNLAWHVLRGVKANMPVLNAGELYLATDEVQLYIGTASGNKLILMSNVATPTGSGGGMSAPKHVAGNPGPLNTMKVVSFAEVIINGTVFWVPLFQ